MLDLSPAMQGFLGGAAAVGFPLLFNLTKEIIFDLRKIKAERTYISVQLVFLLDKFVSECAEVSWDRGFDESYQEPDSPEYLKTQVEPPIFDMSTVKGEYKYIEPTLIYNLQSIDIELLKIKQELREVTENPNFGPEFMDQYILLRRELYADLGLDVALLSENVRNKLKIDADHGWTPKESLLRSKSHIARIKSKGAFYKMLRKSERMMRSKQQPF
ncbi:MULTISPECIES: hypothetical protein [Serratia]|uniref:hypothetical protein n=1 Tax=Serratia TaxID=613 RepID=UPI00197EBB0A|nr:hypothetical protein [Serratia ureilytica]MBN5445569.1 hypothetical protein [Serratia ureilytica]HED2502098.1 hypothetical protein [Serratia marcescens]